MFVAPPDPDHMILFKIMIQKVDGTTAINVVAVEEEEKEDKKRTESI